MGDTGKADCISSALIQIPARNYSVHISASQVVLIHMFNSFHDSECDELLRARYTCLLFFLIVQEIQCFKK